MNPMFKQVLATVLLLSVSLTGGRAKATDDDREDVLGSVAGALDSCSTFSGLGSCLRMRALQMLDRAIKAGPLVVNEYLTYAADTDNGNGTAPPLTLADIESALPKDKTLRDSALDEMISDKLSSFFSTRSLKFNSPTDLFTEGRKKKDKKGGGGVGMLLGVFFTFMVQVAMAKIALLAGKALIVGKIALLLSAVIGLKKLIGGGGHEESGGHQVVYADHHGRSYSHRMAYAAQARAHQD